MQLYLWLASCVKAPTGPSSDSHDAWPVSGSGSFANNTGQDFADVSFHGDSCPRSILVTITQFDSLDFLQSKIGVKKCVFNKRKIKVCISCS